MTGPGPDALGFDAIVLAGGAGRRLGGASGVVKPEVVVAGRALVDHALDAVAGAGRRVLVGPATLARDGVPTTLEDPPLGGPVAGVAAGLAALATGEHPAEVVVVLACDVPRAGEVVTALVAEVSASGVDGACLVDDDGRAQHLVAAYRRAALTDALGRLGTVRDVAVRRLVADLVLVGVPGPAGAAADVDTWPDVRRLETELAAAGTPSAARGPGPSQPDSGRIDGGSVPTPTPPARPTEDAMTDPRRAPGADLPQWVAHLTERLGVDPALVDIDRLLPLSSDVAHSVARPAVPVSMFVAGLAAAGRTPDEIAALLDDVGATARAWVDE